MQLSFPIMNRTHLLFTVQVAFLTIGLVGQSGCAQSPSSPVVRLEGQFILHEEWQSRVYLLKPTYFTKILAAYEMPITDTIELDNAGRFQFTKQISSETAGLYILVSQPKHSRFANALEGLPFRENYILLDLQPGQEIRLHSAVDRLTHGLRILEADPMTIAMNGLHRFRQPLVNSVEAAWNANPDRDQFQWNTHGHDSIRQPIHSGLDQFLDTVSHFLPLITALRLRSPENDYRDNPEFFLRLAEKLELKFPDHPWTKEYRAQLKPDNLPVLIGQQMPPFRLSTPNGDTVENSNLHGKLILVDFWASWCAPCRKENRSTLQPLYEKYHTSGFEIIGISIDSDRNSWINAIEKDSANWLHASDLLGDASPVRQSLKFDTIPACYLLDAKGRLLARNLHGEELNAFVEAYFRK